MHAGHKRSPPTVRWLLTFMRALHIPAVGLILGAWWTGDENKALGEMMIAAAITGVAIGVLFFWQARLWLLELQGIAVIAKIAALGALPHLGHEAGLWLLLGVSFVASFASHMPGRWRHRRIDKWKGEL